MFIAAAALVLTTMAMALLRLFLGPSRYDRVMAVNMFGTKMIMLIAIFGFLTGRPDFLDIALAYAMINFISTIAILKFFRYWTAAGAMENTGAPAPARSTGPT
jgi:multicomponent Na+:H+ antiporter subunit F